MRFTCAISALLGAAIAVAVATERPAHACGCVSPPAVEDGEFAVNQQSEQIIFEVGDDGFVTAHVLIRYSGAPESFAWIVPAPEVPELGLTPPEVFGLLERETAPQVAAQIDNLCPESEYVCRYHSDPFCGGNAGDGDGDGDGDSGDLDAGAGDQDEPPPVEVLDQQTIGSYETITFAAGDAAAAVAWLNAEGFVVNETMAPFMQPYADAGMVFVASKLVAGADVSAIKPLRMRFRSPAPMIPLELTAVAAEPHMTVTTYIYGKSSFAPQGRPLVSIPTARLSVTPEGRVNYPQVMARAIDTAGGDGFVLEYAGPPALPRFGDDPSGCCDSVDFCGIGGDGQCQCPTSDFDQVDCAESEPGLLEALDVVRGFAETHTHLTRLTTRLSPHEMTFDPVFTASEFPQTGRRSYTATRRSLDACAADVIDAAEAAAVRDRQQCAATYCASGECVITNEGAGCRCSPGTVAREFTDLDGRASVTCVPETPLVDLEAGGIDLPDVCSTVDCGAGTCVDLGGFAACNCADGTAAAIGNAPGAPVCRAIVDFSGSVGAEDFTAPLADVAVCAPAAPTCGDGGWLEQRRVTRPGVACSPPPDASRFVAPPEPSCERSTNTTFGCGCSSGSGPGGGGLVVLLAALALLRRRRACN